MHRFAFAVAIALVALSPLAPARGELHVATKPLAAASPATASVPTDVKLAWQRTLGSPAIRIAIVDSGVTAVKPLAANLRPGRNFVDGGTNASDGNGHGTAMASIAASRGSGVAGVCGRCTIVPVRVIANSGFGTTDLAVQGIRWAVAQGARVINVSLTAHAEEPALKAAIDDAVAAGVVVVVAAGNSGSTDPSTGGYPAASNADAISVAGVDASGQLYPWSNHGSWVQIAAPGQLNALTTRASVFAAVGTSGSAAYVSGVVGLMLSANPSLTPAQVQSILLSTGTQSPGLDVRSGRVVDVAAAVSAAAAA